MDEPPSTTQNRPGRLAILCGAALAAAVFTPVPATAFAAMQPLPYRPIASTMHTAEAPAPNVAAEALISIGMAGLGLASGGVLLVAVRRRQY